MKSRREEQKGNPETEASYPLTPNPLATAPIGTSAETAVKKKEEEET